MSGLSYEEFCKAHGVLPLNDIKTACRIASVGRTKFYELVEQHVFELIPNGRRRNVSGQNLYRYYQNLLAATRSGRAA
ncbi:hypothetical protein GPL21_33360 [Bradyrhizobium pachyrhizi]|uniref:Helix-turn-helix domain-containing protein n=1 Tax=Bradyrhizobium pachyrhizi TaxID=280333 RepID=A0A844T1L0_9BRAD|nr:hypothetical protein [Bradyrhizobium pachyrhizi]MVT69974.1 hypothetical protein [Bradyrhizobium pachyrhizi]